ncbi:MAG: hypothetical protein AAGJ40_09060 [Planctomycetota bacterium]
MATAEAELQVMLATACVIASLAAGGFTLCATGGGDAKAKRH